MPPPNNVAIVGAGLAGPALALSLLHQLPQLKVTVYESRPAHAPSPTHSGVVLTPNGLRILDKLGIFDRIKDRCWKNEYRTYKNDRDETTRRVLVASEAVYGYCNHRLWRQILLDELRRACVERGVNFEFESRFEAVVGEDESRIRFLVNGRECWADMLFAADGIYSSVRRYVEPGNGPEYVGTTGVLAHIKWADVQWPYEGFERQCTIQTEAGAMFYIPENADGSEIMVGCQAKWDDLGREGFEEMAKDKESLCAFWRRNYDEWHETGKKIIDAVCKRKDDMYLWPFVRMPRLKKWFSEMGRVVLVGDAAHAVPPSSGQGVNQALEDVYSLSILLGSHRELAKCLQFWQEMRQARIEDVYEWSTRTNLQRMPEAERQALIREGKIKDPETTESFEDMRWLYQVDLDEIIDG